MNNPQGKPYRVATVCYYLDESSRLVDALRGFLFANKNEEVKK